MRRNSLKTWLFYSLLFSKLLIIAYIIYESNAGGLNPKKNQGWVTIAITLPLFSVYLTTIFADYIANPVKKKYKDEAEKEELNPKLRSPIVFASFIFPVIYLFLIYWVIDGFVSEDFTYNLIPGDAGYVDPTDPTNNAKVQLVESNLETVAFNKMKGNLGIVESVFGGIYLGPLVQLLFKTAKKS